MDAHQDKLETPRVINKPVWPAHALPCSTVLDIPLSTFGMTQAVEFSLNFLSQNSNLTSSGYLCFANVHTVTESQYHPALKTALSHASAAVADGLPLVWASRLFKNPIQSRVCGPDFMKEFISKTPQEVHGFIGAKIEQSQAIANQLGIRAVCYSPPFRPYSPENALEDWKNFELLATEKAKEFGALPRFIWVGLGAPKQELWMHTVSKSAQTKLFFGVGAAFDFLSGTKKRAPKWMQHSGLEWLYRLLQEPRRLAERYLRTNTLFLYYLARSKIKGTP